MKDSFFSFDDDEMAPVISRSVERHRAFLQDPRDAGGVLVDAKPVDRASCSICSATLHLEVFYFEGKIRRFVRCEGCKHYLFELERRRK